MYVCNTHIYISTCTFLCYVCTEGVYNGFSKPITFDRFIVLSWLFLKTMIIYSILISKVLQCLLKEDFFIYHMYIGGIVYIIFTYHILRAIYVCICTYVACLICIYILMYVYINYVSRFVWDKFSYYWSDFSKI